MSYLVWREDDTHSPEADEWLKKVNEILEAEVERHLVELVCFGSTIHCINRSPEGQTATTTPVYFRAPPKDGKCKWKSFAI